MPLRRISQNSLILMASNGGSAILAFGLTLIIARGLGDATLGQYATVMAWILPLTLFVDFGIGTLITRNIAQQPHQAADYLRAALPARILLGSGVVLLVWLITPYLSDDILIQRGLRIAVILVLIDTLFGNYTAVFRAWERMLPILFLNVGLLSMQVVAAGLVVYFAGDVTALLAGIVVADGIQLGATWLVWRWLKKQYITEGTALKATNIVSTRALLKTAMPFMVAGVLASLQIRGVILLLEQFDSAETVGWYAAANRVTEAFRLIPTALFGALFPALAGLVKEPDQFQRIFRYAMASVGVYGGLVMALLVGGRHLIVEMLYGHEFAPAADILLILSIALAFSIVRGILILWFYAYHRERVVNRWLAVILFGQVIVALWLLPAYGGQGAAWVVLLGELGLLSILSLKRKMFMTQDLNEQRLAA